MKTILMVGLVLALGVQAYAAPVAAGNAVGTGGGKKTVDRSLTLDGNPLQFNDDKPWKVFSIEYVTAPVLVVDEGGVAPKQGLVKRICVESGVAAGNNADWTVVWDTLAVAGMTGTGIGRRIAPPIGHNTNAVTCVEVNAMFTSGLAIMQGAATGSSYIYWRELGGRLR